MAGKQDRQKGRRLSTLIWKLQKLVIRHDSCVPGWGSAGIEVVWPACGVRPALHNMTLKMSSSNRCQTPSVGVDHIWTWTLFRRFNCRFSPSSREWNQHTLVGNRDQCCALRAEVCDHEALHLTLPHRISARPRRPDQIRGRRWSLHQDSARTSLLIYVHPGA